MRRTGLTNHRLLKNGLATTGESLRERLDCKVLIALLCIDSVFVVLHILTKLDFTMGHEIVMSQDRGPAEWFQYFKIVCVISLLAKLAIARRSTLCLIWSVMFAYILLDDCFEIHETGGRYFASLFGFSPAYGLRAYDFGELAIYGLMAIVSFGAIILAYMAADEADRRTTKLLLGLLAGLAFFAIVVDMFPYAANQRGFGTLEETGEHVFITLFVWVLLREVYLGTCAYEENPRRKKSLSN